MDGGPPSDVMMECTRGETQECGSNVGACSAGMRSCVDGQWSECEGEVGPADEEVCDAEMVDENCDGSANEGCACIPTEMRTCGDSDEGICMRGTVTCQADATWGECEGAINPGTEVCDGMDNDCDGMTDEGLLLTFYRDADGDSFGVTGMTTEACTLPVGYALMDGDCNDDSVAVNPSRTEICDLLDNDCDTETDEGVQTRFYRDMDMDTFGDPSSGTDACTPPAGFVANDMDCNDGDSEIYPGRLDDCDGSDCDMAIDEDANRRWYLDIDDDGYGTGAAVIQCARPSSQHVTDTGDCNDGDQDINPGETELCDLVDNNCNGQRDEVACQGSCVPREFDGRNYLFCERDRTWVEARNDCRTFGPDGIYQLTAINNLAEHSWTMTTAHGIEADQWWIGLNDRGVGSEGDYDWTSGDSYPPADGAPANYWAPGEPNNSGDCMVTNFFIGGGRGWDDLWCGNDRFYICEEQ